jgi:cell division protein FtsA
MAKHAAVGIDIGSYHVKVVVAEESPLSHGMPSVLGVGYSESKGLRHGYIINRVDAIRSIRKAIRQAERTSNTPIKRVFLSVGGIGLSSYRAVGEVMISRADNEITELDVDKALAAAQQAIPQSISINKKSIHQIPIQFRIEGKPILGSNPIGMKGVKLEVDVLFVMSLEHHLSELIQAVEDAGVEIADVMAAPLAASLVSLSKAEKIAGVILTNIGSETVSIVVYEDDIPISLETFPVGSNDITNDIALGLQVSLDEAETIKTEIEHGNIPAKHPRKKLDDIIDARLSDIFDLVAAHLKKIGKSGMLPAGIVITGGGSGITTIEDLAKAYLKLPSKVARLICNDQIEECIHDKTVSIKDATWAVAYGLCVFGLHAEGEGTISNFNVLKTLKGLRDSCIKFFKQFLP